MGLIHFAQAFSKLHLKKLLKSKPNCLSDRINPWVQDLINAWVKDGGNIWNNTCKIEKYPGWNGKPHSTIFSLNYELGYQMRLVCNQERSDKEYCIMRKRKNADPGAITCSIFKSKVQNGPAPNFFTFMKLTPKLNIRGFKIVSLF